MRTAAWAVALALVAGAPPLQAQSLLERTANISGDWVTRPGVVQFNFLHRFVVSDPPERKVTNFPTFTLATGIVSRVSAGANYTTNSVLAPRYPNEWELFARWQPLMQSEKTPVTLGGQLGYNSAASGVDGEVSVGRRFGLLKLLGVARLLSNPYEDGEVQFAYGGGVIVQPLKWLAISGDVATLAERDTARGEEVAWGAMVAIAIPGTPHTFSLEASNANSLTLQGASRGLDRVRYGFEFTIPITLARYFGGGKPKTALPPASEDSNAAQASGVVVHAGMNGMAFTPSRIEVAPGTTVTWRNDDPVAHTVTASDGSFNSGALDPGKTWSHTFVTPGEHNFFCTPHPFMTGVVVVR